MTRSTKLFPIRIYCVFSLGCLLFISAGTAGCQENEQTQTGQMNVDNNIVLDWNEMAYRLGYEHDQFYSFIGVRTLAMTHLAIHDALNAIQPTYESYAYDEKHPDADPVASVAQAAYEVLFAAFPDRQDTLDLVRNQWLNTVEDGKAKQQGITLGSQTAQTIIELRRGDGHLKQGGYTPMTKPGDYQYTPGWDEWVLKPDFDYARPFALDTVTQFRSPPPPALDSEEYLQSFREVKEYGGKQSQSRTEDQTHYAHWWAEFAEHSWNRIGRITARQHELSIMEAARLFALINMDIYDIYLASLESKYYYDTWRPYTAIRQADKDDNPHTEPDPDWEPEMLTPPWPEYPSAHAAVGAGGAEIIAQVLGTKDVSFTMESTSALVSATERTYNNLDSAASDCADSRIMNGYHFRFATDEGKKQGRSIAHYIRDHYLRSLSE